jgi:ribosome biogenesis protein BMS1
MSSPKKNKKEIENSTRDSILSEVPPFIVVIQGPSRVGKSTLIRGLVEYYSTQHLQDTTGPITIIAGKTRRLTFIECPQDIDSMIDIAKIADLVICLIDGSFGFEIDTFEFLGLLQVHGFPRIIGLLTHMDKFNLQKELKNVKKNLKHRFWSEVYKGAKLFYFSTFAHEKYLKREIANLARFLSVQKFRSQSWRFTHPYILVDRIEDVTESKIVRQKPKISHDLVFYGYARGNTFNEGYKFHVLGVGDFDITEVSLKPDPCPLTNPIKRRGLNEKERLIYGPMTNVYCLPCDKNDVYSETHSFEHVQCQMNNRKDIQRIKDNYRTELPINKNTTLIFDAVNSLQRVINLKDKKIDCEKENEDSDWSETDTNIEQFISTYHNQTKLFNGNNFNPNEKPSNHLATHLENRFDNNKNDEIYDFHGSEMRRVRKKNREYFLNCPNDKQTKINFISNHEDLINESNQSRKGLCKQENTSYDEKHSKPNIKKEYPNLLIDGIKPASYLAVLIKGIPYELISNFRPTRPLVIAGVATNDNYMGYLKVRMKRHRWYPKMLKNQDPQTFSVSWRRYHSIPTFAVDDQCVRLRMLKYAPDQMHCIAIFWGPFCIANTGVVCFNHTILNHRDWRISATGAVMEMSTLPRVVTKLKLVGFPYLIRRRTALIQNMFNSLTEASAFEGSSIRTVSGIRGTIKKALRAGAKGWRPGSFLATLEEHPLLSDIVYTRAWVPVEIKRVYYPVINLLMPPLYLNATQYNFYKYVNPTLSNQFIPSNQFIGYRENYVFKTDINGTGYYTDFTAKANILTRTNHVWSNTEIITKNPTTQNLIKENSPRVKLNITNNAQLQRELSLTAPRTTDSLYFPTKRTTRSFKISK